MTPSASTDTAPRIARIGRIVRAAAVAGAVMSVAACNPAPAPPDAKFAADGWHDFQGSWIATGQRHTIPFGADRRVAVVDLTGSMFVAGPSSPGLGFRAQTIALGDSATGVVGRAVWTDDRGDQIFSEFRGDDTATGSRIAGTFVGGTGRYAGATGTYEFTWQYVLQAEDGTVQGRATGLTGRVRVGSAPGTASAPAEKP